MSNPGGGSGLSVVVPAYNEAGRLGPTLERVVAYLERRGGPCEILVVDDGSTDGTAEIARGFSGCGVQLLARGENGGKGAALRDGVLASRGERVLLTDADLSTPIAELERLEPHLAEADLVLGSRAVGSASIVRHQPLHRELMGKAFNLLIRLLGVHGLRDTQCGFKLLRGDVARALFADLTVTGFAYDVELVCLARARGHRIAEVGVEWADSPESKVRLVTDSLRMLRDVVRIRLRTWIR